MKIVCDNCKRTDGHKYTTFMWEHKLVTLCGDCRWGTTGTTSSADKDKHTWEHISTPWWVHMGLEPKTEVEKKQVAHLKKHNMTWGELRKERDMRLNARYRTGWQNYQNYRNGGNSEVKYEKS